jgi:hypothetical protein
MWTAIVLIAAYYLALGQSGSLQLTNARTTYSILGATRTDESVLPGDLVVLCFDIVGAKADAAGKVRYSIAMEVADADGKVAFKQAPQDRQAPLAAGANSLPACATINVGRRQPPGDYTVKIIVKDLTSGETGELSRRYKLLPTDFGIVRYSTSRDADGKMPVDSLRAHRRGYINFVVVGFEHAQRTQQPHVAVEMRVLDQQGNPVVKPSTGEVKEGVPNQVGAIPMQFEMNMPRGGEFVVELKATDKLSGKSASLKVPLSVLETK